MKRITFNKLILSLFFTGILVTTLFPQNITLRKKYTSFFVADCSWALKNPSNSSDTKKQIPFSASIMEEEEDKIVEEIDAYDEPLQGTFISISFAVRPQFFEEPFLKVNALPPWTV
jgi:hypothetical protein